MGNRMTKKIEEIIKRNVIDQWVLKGHSLSGSFEESLRVEVTEGSEGTSLKLFGNSYGSVLNKGVPASNIPYTSRRRGQGSGGTSKYLTGLINYVKMRMGVSDPKEAKSIAFAIAEKHKKNGILGSGFLDEAIEKSKKELDKAVLEMLNDKIKEI